MYHSIPLDQDAAVSTSTNEYEDVRRAKYLINIIMDKSGSVIRYLDQIKNSVICILKTLAAHPLEDYDTLVQVLAFNGELQVLNDVPMEPGALLEVLDIDSVQAWGSTAIGKVYAWIDAQFTRSNPLVKANANMPAPATFNIIITDFQANDDKDSRSNSMDSLKSNRIAQARGETLVVYIGNDDPSKKPELMHLVNQKKENIVRITSAEALDERIIAPRMCNTVLNMHNPTHIKGNSSGGAYQTATSFNDAERKSAGALKETPSPDKEAEYRDKLINALRLNAS